MKTRLLLLCIAVGLLICFPWMVEKNTPVTIATQMLVWMVFALSYNIVLGQTGLLSFGHAIFFGAGAFAASHIISAADGGAFAGWPVWLTPIPAFIVGAITAFVLGSFLAARTGTAFVMITLALSQLVIYLAIAFDSIFGGEGGIGIDRAYDDFLFGLASFGPTQEAYWLVLFWAVVAGGLIWLQSHTAFGMLAQATRENEERVRFSGQSTYRIRLMALVIAGGFAGLAGALHALNIEQVSTDQFSLKTSAFALFMCVIGGSKHFLGPVIGAVILSILDKILPDYSGAWLLYLGLIFCIIILYAPGGIAGLVDDTWNRYRDGRGNVGHDLILFTAMLVMAVGVIMGVEMAYELGEAVDAASAEPVHLFGLTLAPNAWMPWLIAAALAVAGHTVLRKWTSDSQSEVTA